LLAGELRVNRTVTDPQSNYRNKNDDADAYAKRIVAVKGRQLPPTSHENATELDTGSSAC